LLRLERVVLAAAEPAAVEPPASTVERVAPPAL
jgi:hypothetical protein